MHIQQHHRKRLVHVRARVSTPVVQLYNVQWPRGRGPRYKPLHVRAGVLIWTARQQFKLFKRVRRIMQPQLRPARHMPWQQERNALRVRFWLEGIAVQRVRPKRHGRAALRRARHVHLQRRQLPMHVPF